MQKCHGGSQSLISSVASALACQAMVSHTLQQLWKRKACPLCWHTSWKEQMPKTS